MKTASINDGVILFLIATCFELIPEVTAAIPKLTALNNSFHAMQLYEDVANENEPSEADPAKRNARVRSRICDGLTRTGFFRDSHLLPIQRVSQVVEPYTFRRLTVNVNDLSYFEDFCFKCHFERALAGDLREFYVSKEYNVSSAPDHYKPGRFLVGRISLAYLPFPGQELILAEESADAYTDSNFNVELHYLRIRKYIRRVRSNEIDPLCRLVSSEENSRNQHYRLCVAVMTSAYFEESFGEEYAHSFFCRCVRKKITFRSPEAIEKAAGRSYYERMTRCSQDRDGDPEYPVLYISRAYFSNQVFVLRRDAYDKKILYLENLSTNVSIADVLNSFDFVES